MDKKSVVALLAVLAITGCSKLPKPPVVDGRHRQPVNSAGIHIDEPAVQAGTAQTSEQTPANMQPSPAPPRKEVGISSAPRVYRVQFAYGSTKIDVTPETLGALLPYATHALKIEVRGRTDGKHWSKGDEHVALGRAVAARKLLVSKGVDPKKITLNYLSGGDYIGDNTTHDGQAVNRRVDIVMFAGN